MSVEQISAQDAFELLKKDQKSILIDVRTIEELNFVGVIESSSFLHRMELIPWQIFPEMMENPDFISGLNNAVNKHFGNDSLNAKIVFICRSGVRSNYAAHCAVANGYNNCYNVISGFEGDLNQQRQRGKTNGWKASNLPWRQT